MSNIYYSPESYGLQIVATVDFADSYEFDMWIALRDPETNVLYVGADSGCSCPSPFEDDDRSTLTACRSWAEFHAWVNDQGDTSDRGYTGAHGADFVSSVMSGHSFRLDTIA